MRRNLSPPPQSATIVIQSTEYDDVTDAPIRLFSKKGVGSARIHKFYIPTDFSCDRLSKDEYIQFRNTFRHGETVVIMFDPNTHVLHQLNSLKLDLESTLGILKKGIV